MKNKIFLTIVLLITSKLNYSQTQDILIKDQAVIIEKTDSLSNQVYELLSKYRLIMLGEIHGTNEPVDLLNGIVSLLTKNGDSLQVGFEIPSKQMTHFIKKRKENSILKTEFFLNPSGDGRASIAWYKALANLSRNKKVKIFFFDKNADQEGDADSIMFLNIKSKLNEHPNWKIITICGGIHNRILPYEGQNKIGNFLMEDKDLNISESLCSLNHEFESGETLWNEFKAMPSIYSKSGYEKYLYLFPIGANEAYQGVFFTKYLTKSESSINK